MYYVSLYKKYAEFFKILIRKREKLECMADEDEAKESSSEENTSEEPGPDEKYCSSCGEIIDEEAEICPECGVRVKEKSESNNVNINMENNQVQNQSGQKDEPATSNKSKNLAGLLGILLGGIGAHKFYVGQPGRGLLFLLFCWTYIPAIIGFIQGASYLLMSEQKFARKFG